MKLKETYFVYGMHCAACQATIQNKVSKAAGVCEVNVNLLTKKMQIEYDDEKLNDQKIKNIVTSLGYKALKADEVTSQENDELKSSKLKLKISLIFGIPLILIVMLAMFGVFPFVSFATFKNGIWYVLFQIIFIIPILVVNFSYFSSGFKNLFKLHPNMDSLIAIGSFAAIAYSLINLVQYYLLHTIEPSDHFILHSFYFETAGMILTIVTIGKYLESSSKAKTNDSISKLLELMPSTCNLVTDEGIEVVDTASVKAGSILLIKPGEKIPLDGEIINGQTSIDESVVTGESIPVFKEIGDKVTIATQNKNGSIRIKVDSEVGNTWLDNIVHLVEEASSTKGKVERLADKISLFFVPIIILIAVVTFILWKVFNQTTNDALMSAISVLVIACPCSLGLATPTSIMVGMGKGANYGILFKNAESLEVLGKVDTIVFDKTGTITEGEPRVVKITKLSEVNEAEILRISATIENQSEHPLAQAICSYNKLEVYSDIQAFETISGKGLAAIVNNQQYYLGNPSYIGETTNLNVKLPNNATTKVVLATPKELLGIIEITDEIKHNAKYLIEELHKRNIKTVIATGDNQLVASDVKEKLQIDEVLAELLPADKMKYIAKLEANGERVAMIGDGINDSVALTKATVGIAIGAGTDIAKESADVVLVKSDLEDVLHAYDLSKKVMRNIKQNLFWALIYNVIGVVMTTGLYYVITGHPFNPMFGALAMSLSSVCVVTNALRLRTITFKYLQTNEMNKGEKTMTKTLKIVGMMCENCERHVKKGLEAIPGLKVEVSHKTGEAVVTINDSNITDEMLIEAVNEAGYKVTSIQ